MKTYRPEDVPDEFLEALRKEMSDLDQGSISVTNLLPDLTEIITTRDIGTPAGVLPAGSRGTIVTTYDHGGFYGVEFAAPFHIAWLTRGDLLPIECD